MLTGQYELIKSSRLKIFLINFSVIFILLSILIGLLLHFGYTRVDTWVGSKGDTLTLRAFINALAFDTVLTVISPLMLIYSSKDLREAIQERCHRHWQHHRRNTIN